MINPRFFLVLLSFLVLQSCEEKKQEEQIKATVVDSIAIHWQTLIVKYPDSLLLKENLLQHYRDNQQIPKAIETVGRYLKSDSLNARLWSIKAILHYENEDTSSSINAFEKAISIEPSLEDLKSLGSLYAGITHPRTKTLTQMMRKFYPNQTEKEALFIEGTYNANLLEYAKAIQLYDKCIELEYGFMQAYGEKAKCQIALYQYQNARQTLERAVKLQNKYLDGWFLLGQVCEELQDNTAAESAYRRILLYESDHEDAKERLRLLGAL
jgi:tetratricopeptide (TPR) repeat protein